MNLHTKPEGFNQKKKIIKKIKNQPFILPPSGKKLVQIVVMTPKSEKRLICLSGWGLMLMRAATMENAALLF